MDHFSRATPATSVGQPGSNFQGQPTAMVPQVFNNLGAAHNIAGMDGSYNMLANQSMPYQNFNPHFAYGANTTGFNSLPNQCSNSYLQGYGADSTGANAMSYEQTMPNQSSKSHSSQIGTGWPRRNPSGCNNRNFHQTIANEGSDAESGIGQAQKRKENTRRKVLLPTPTMKCSSPGASGQDRGKPPRPEGSQYGGRRSAPGSSRYREDSSSPNSSQYGGNRSAHSASLYEGSTPIKALDARGFGGDRPVPDGTSNVKYPAPDVNNLTFDSSTGYRFDLTTGLHYDANSGFYLNNQLKVLLRWDPLTSTYVLVSNNTAGLSTPVVTLLNRNQSSGGSMTAGFSPEGLKVLARELAPLLKSETQEPDPVPKRTREPNQYLNDDRYQRSDMDHFRDPETSLQRDRTADLYPSNPKRARWCSPRRLTPVDEADLWDGQEPGTWRSNRSPSPNEVYQGPDYDRHASRERTWDDRRRSIPADPSWNDRRGLVPADHMWDDRRDSIEADRMWDDRHEPAPAGRQRDDKRDPIHADRTRNSRWDVIPFRGSSSPSRGSRSQPRSRSRGRELLITEIHQHNLKDGRNLYGRYFPNNPSPSTFLLVAPVPPKNEMSRQDVSMHLEHAVSSDRLAFRSIDVHQGGFGAPCNYALVRFNSEEAALQWYKSHQGTIVLGNPRAAHYTFLFFAEGNWICSKQHGHDKGCDTPTPNFPYRTLCYKCLELRTKLQSPIIKKESPTKWIGISQLDCLKYTSVIDVLNRLPSHRGITIASTEFLREPSGLPIGLCVFEIPDKEQSTHFFKILKNERFNVSYVYLDKRALDCALTSSNTSVQKGRERASSWLELKAHTSMRPENRAESVKEKLQSTTVGPRRKRKRNRKKPDPRGLNEIMVESHGGKYLVLDECKETENDDENKNQSEPCVSSGSVRKLIVDENVASVHTQNSKDPDNVLRELFVQRPALRTFVLLAPVPGGDRGLVKKDLENTLTSGGCEFKSVGVFQGKGLGAPCHYGLVQFNERVNALSWYIKHKGLVHLKDGGSDQFKAFMYFSRNNWACHHCEFPNFPLRTWCNRCFKNRDKSTALTVSESRTPTQFLGISSVGLPPNMPESSFTADNILASLPQDESKRLVSCKMMLEDKGLPGLCVLEAQDTNDCETLRLHLLSKGLRASFLQMHCEPAGKDSSKASGAENASVVAQPEQKDPVPFNQNSLKYDPMKYIFDNSKPSQFFILSPSPTLNWSAVKEQMDKRLAGDGVNYSCSYDICQPEVYGSPHDYIQVRFIDAEKAESWYHKHNGSVELVFPPVKKQRAVKFKMILYYSENAWTCRACCSPNFPPRSLCHKCYVHRDEDGFTPVTISSTPTRWVAISGLPEAIYNVGQVKKALQRLDLSEITRMHFIKEPNPLLHVGLCVIETPTTSDGQSLAENIQKHPTLKYNARSKVIFVNFNPQPGEESCEQHSELDKIQRESTLPSLRMINDTTDNTHLYWQNLTKGIEEGEDTLKDYFEDPFIAPMTAGKSVFAPLPCIRQITGPTRARQFRTIFLSLLRQHGVNAETAEYAKMYVGKNVGGPCPYTILTFKTVIDADRWCSKHNGKWVIHLQNGSTWTSFLHLSIPNWKCGKCSIANFPLRLYCFWCFEQRVEGAPIVTISDKPSRFIGITRFQNWCATEEILFENIEFLRKMKDDQQLKAVHYPTEPSGMALGICVLELENIALAGNVLTRLAALTQKRQVIVYLESNPLFS